MYNMIIRIFFILVPFQSFVWVPLENLIMSYQINDRVIKKLCGQLKEGYSEKYYLRLLADIYEEEGAQGFSFDPILAFEAHSVDPHHEPGTTKLKKEKA